MNCAVSPCGDRATTRLRFWYGRAFEDVAMCARHSWPWRVGRGNGTVDLEQA